MENRPLPTLSIQGWIMDPSTKLDYLLAHFYESDYNQTQLYPEYISSITKIMQATGGEANSVIGKINEILNSYLSNYFNNVYVEVKPATNLDDDATDRIEIIIEIKIIERQTTIEYSRLLKFKDSKMSEIIKLNN